MTGSIHDTWTWARPLKTRWMVKYYSEGRQWSVPFADRADAEQHLADMQGKLRPTPPKPCEHCGAPLPDNRRRFCSDQCRHRRYRAERTIETAEFGRFAIYMIRSLARRIGGSDIAQFGALWEVMSEAERAVTDAITGLRSAGFTWEELGAEIGVSRQAVQQWHKRRLADADTSGQASTESAVNESLTATKPAGGDVPTL